MAIAAVQAGPCGGAGLQPGRKAGKLGAGLLLGPYGLGLAAAGKEHQQKERKLYAREIHLKCSSQPLPRELQAADTTETGRRSRRTQPQLSAL